MNSVLIFCLALWIGPAAAEPAAAEPDPAPAEPGPAPASADPPTSAGPPAPALTPETPDERKPDVALRVGYYGPYIIQPGLALGAEVTIRAWDQTKARERGTLTKTRSLFAGPRLAFFGRPQNHLSLLVDAAFGYRTFWDRRAVFSSWSLAAGYMLALQTVAQTIELGTGASTSRVREARHALLPTLHYDVGQEFPAGLGWYLGLSVGYEVGIAQSNALFYATELGLLVRLGAGRSRR